jgi:hypothetical protein
MSAASKVLQHNKNEAPSTSAGATTDAKPSDQFKIATETRPKQRLQQ